MTFTRERLYYKMKYLFFLKRAFKNNTIYRFDYILSWVNICLQIFISCEIWKALYISNSDTEAVSVGVIITSFIVNLGLANVYLIDDLAVQKKIWDGTIICELLKPINYRVYLLADTIGSVLFKLIFNLLPCTVMMIVIYRKYFIVCNNIRSFVVFLVSVFLGFLVLWEISSIVQMLCFWFVNVWSISTIKSVFINILAGSLLPFWYLPETVQKIIELTPFSAIYITPIKIYLGQIDNEKQIEALMLQFVWIVVLSVIGNVLWSLGKKKMVIQGG